MDKKALHPKPSMKSSAKSQEEAVPILPVKREGTKHVQTMREGDVPVTVPGVGIVVINPKDAAMMNGKILDPRPIEKLTGKALEIRESQKEYLRSRGVDFGPSDTPAGPIDTVVMSPANPYLSLYREYRIGQITLPEMIECIDVSICSDPDMLQSYHAKAMPTKPKKLIEAEERYKAKADAEEWESGLPELRIKMRQIEPEIDAWMRSCERIKAENASNFFALNEMLERQTEKNQAFAGKIREVIFTHQTI